MAVVSGAAREEMSADTAALCDSLAERFGRLPAIFAVMARRPAVLAHFLPLYAAIMRAGTVPPTIKELVYLKTSLVNGCEY